MIAYKGFDKDMQCRGFRFEEGETYPIISVAAGIVDGVTLKEKTWYKCVGGKFVEV